MGATRFFRFEREHAFLALRPVALRELRQVIENTAENLSKNISQTCDRKNLPTLYCCTGGLRPCSRALAAANPDAWTISFVSQPFVAMIAVWPIQSFRI